MAERYILHLSTLANTISLRHNKNIKTYYKNNVICLSKKRLKIEKSLAIVNLKLK